MGDGSCFRGCDDTHGDGGLLRSSLDHDRLRLLGAAGQRCLLGFAAAEDAQEDSTNGAENAENKADVENGQRSACGGISATVNVV